MTGLHSSAASLRIKGDDLDPDEISRILCCSPTIGFRKGQLFRQKSTGQDFAKKSGMWILDADDEFPGNLDKQIERIFQRLNSDLDIWAEIARRFEIHLSCGFFMKSTNEGIAISPNMLRILGDRSISLDLSIYAPLT